jgi:hypothetical protein
MSVKHSHNRTKLFLSPAEANFFTLFPMFNHHKFPWWSIPIGMGTHLLYKRPNRINPKRRGWHPHLSLVTKFYLPLRACKDFHQCETLYSLNVIVVRIVIADSCYITNLKAKDICYISYSCKFFPFSLSSLTITAEWT